MKTVYNKEDWLYEMKHYGLVTDFYQDTDSEVFNTSIVYAVFDKSILRGCWYEDDKMGYVYSGKDGKGLRLFQHRGRKMKKLKL